MVREILRNIWRRKLRSGLTILGVGIGVFALVVLGAMAEKINFLSSGASHYFRERIFIGQRGSSPFFSSLIPKAIARQILSVEGVGCMESQFAFPLEEEVRFTLGMPRTIMGINIEEWEHCLKVNPKLGSLSLARGRWWQAEERGKAVLGSDIADFFDAQPGEKVILRGKEFLVTGVLEPTLSAPDNMVFIPQEDARLIFSQTNPLLEGFDLSGYVTQLYALPLPGYDPGEVVAALEKELPDYSILSPEKIVREIRSGVLVFNAIIFGVSLIGLIIGSLSIINTMVISVAERTKEIGLKKAVGASNRDIFKEYLVESAFIGLFGGIFGLLSGWLVVGMLNYFLAPSPAVFLLTPRLILGALSFALFIGLAAGIFPAMRAAALNPVEALRTE